jgi:adenosylcobinamide kinase/adenosylcobinamide-phosphate guanylyltransferase
VSEPIDYHLAEKKVLTEMKKLIECVNKLDANFIIVSNEVGMGLVPESRLGRIYRDLLGKANQLLAANADEVYILTCGIPIKIKPSVNLL